MKIIFFHFFLFLVLVFLHGFIFLKKILNSKREHNFYETSTIGLIITIIYAQFVNFFIPLNNNLLLLNIILLAVFIVFFFKEIVFDLKFNLKILITLLFISIVNIYGSGFSDDINHYHYSFIANTDVNNLIWGNSFLHPLYGTTPSWLFAHSYFNFDQFKLQDIHILNGLTFFLIMGCFITELYSKDKNRFYYPILFMLVMFILLKYTRLKEFGLDRPATLFFSFLVYYYLKYLLVINRQTLLKDFIIICLLSIFIFSIKVIYLPVLFVPIFILYKYNAFLIKKEFSYLIILFSIITIVIKNLLSTGCLVFPVVNSCIEYFSWSNHIGAKELSISAEIFNKSWHSFKGLLTMEEYIQNFNWFITWFERSKIEILELFLTSFFIIIITIMCFRLKFIRRKLKFKHFNDLKIILILIIFFSSILFFTKNPVLRMNHYVIISLMVLILSFFFRSKTYNYKILFMTLLLCSALTFNLIKNIYRLSKINFVNDPYKMISNKINEQKKMNIDGFKYYSGWYGKAPIASSPLGDDKGYKKKLIFDIIYIKKN